MTTVQRPTLVKVMCIITWVLLGISAIVSLLALIGIMGAKSAGVELGAMYGMLLTSTLVGIAMLVVAFIGTLKMWKMKKMGFYLFTGALVVNQILPLILVPGAQVSVLGIILALAMIVLFGINFKKMN